MKKIRKIAMLMIILLINSGVYDMDDWEFWAITVLLAIALALFGDDD